MIKKDRNGINKLYLIDKEPRSAREGEQAIYIERERENFEDTFEEMSDYQQKFTVKQINRYFLRLFY